MSAQKPVDSGFGAASTASDVLLGIDLTGKIAIVTGGYAGLGLETVRVLRAAGATVIVPARDQNKAAKAVAAIPGVELESLDLMAPATIDAFVKRFLASGRPLHILINCAGIMACPLTRDARGYESQFATNHLGHFQLTTSLRPALAKAQGARVVSVSSRGHRFSPIVFDDVHFERRAYEPMSAYGQSKTANILFALELDKRWKGDGIRAFSLHPGAIIDTDLGRHLPKERFLQMGVIDASGKPILDPLRQLKNVQQGASTGVWCATSPKLAGLGGVYCENNDVATVVESMGANATAGADAKGNFGVLPHAVDPDAAARLWDLSERLLA